MKKLLILVLALCCTSCSALPAEERAFAVALCVEKTGAEWQVQSRIPAYKTGGKYLTVTGKGPTISAALTDMDASAPMKVTLSQLRLLVLNAGLGQTGAIPEALLALSSMLDVRPQCHVAVTEASSDAVMEALTPETGARLSKMLDVLLEARIEQGAILSTKLADVIRMGDRRSPVLMRLQLSEKKLDLSGAWPMRMDGHLTQPLPAEDTVLLSFLTGDTKEARMTFPDGTAMVRDVSVTACLSDDQRTAHVTLTLQMGESSFTAAQLEELLADALVKLLSHLSAEGCDVLGLGRKAALHQSVGVGWPEAYREIRWEVSVGVTKPI